MTTAIAQPGAAIGSIEVVRALSGIEAAYSMIGRAFPGELDETQRTIKGKALLENAAAYMANLKEDALAVLLQCVRQSLVESLITLASIDLTLTKSLGHAFLIPYSRICTLRIGYKGLCELIYRTGSVSSIQTAVVYQGEFDQGRFEYQLGTDGFVNHKPLHERIERDWDHTYCAWMLAETTGGGRVIEVTDKKELIKIRAAAKKMAKGPAWTNWEMQMTRKAPVNRGASYLPKGTGPAALAMARALAIEHKEYDLHAYHAMRKVESRKLTDEAAASLTGQDGQAAPPKDGKTAPSPDKTFAEGKEALWDAVVQKRLGANSSLDDAGFVAAVIESLFGKGKKITSKAQLLVLNNALFKQSMYDWETGEKIPLGKD